MKVKSIKYKSKLKESNLDIQKEFKADVIRELFKKYKDHFTLKDMMYLTLASMKTPLKPDSELAKLFEKAEDHILDSLIRESADNVLNLTLN